MSLVFIVHAIDLTLRTLLHTDLNISPKDGVLIVSPSINVNTEFLMQTGEVSILISMKS
jgi:hypothetical protein